MGEAAGSEKYADNGPDSGDSEPYGKGANHPFTVWREPSFAGMHVAFDQANKEHDCEEHSGGGLVRAADGHLRAHDKSRTADDEAGNQDDAANPAMEFRPAVAQPADELQRCEQDKEQAGSDVEHGQERMARETGVHLRGFRKIRGSRRRREKRERPAHHDGHSDQHQEERDCPDNSYERGSWLHPSRRATSGSTRLAQRAGR